MEWLTQFITWLGSSASRPAIFMALTLFVAVLLAGLFSVLISRGSIKHLAKQHNRELKNSAIMALVSTANEAASWYSLTSDQQILVDRAISQADLQVRMLPIPGSAVAADWAGFQLRNLKHHSASTGVQLDPAIMEFRDQLVAWQRHPRRTQRRLQDDVSMWERERLENPQWEAIEAQEVWLAEQQKLDNSTSAISGSYPQANIYAPVSESLTGYSSTAYAP